MSDIPFMTTGKNSIILNTTAQPVFKAFIAPDLLMLWMSQNGLLAGK